MKLMLPLRLDHRPLNVFDRADLLLPRRLGKLFGRDALPAEVLLDHLPILDDDDRVALEHRPRPSEPEVQVRRSHLEQRERSDRDHRAGH